MKWKARTVVRRGEKSLHCDPRSELRLRGRENKRAKILNGMSEKSRKKTQECLRSQQCPSGQTVVTGCLLPPPRAPLCMPSLILIVCNVQSAMCSSNFIGLVQLTTLSRFSDRKQTFSLGIEPPTPVTAIWQLHWNRRGTTWAVKLKTFGGYIHTKLKNGI